MVLHDFLCGRVGHRQGPFPKATTLVVAFFVFGVIFGVVLGLSEGGGSTYLLEDFSYR